jgi:hypothetical protein
MTGRIEFAGRGLSPRAVVAALQGEGSVGFAEGKLPVLTPGIITVAADAALKAEPGKLAGVVRQTLASGLGAGALPLRRATVSLEIADGQVRSGPLVVETSEGRSSATARLDLKTLKLDSQGRVEGNAPVPGAAASVLPAVVVSYRAPLAALSTAETRIDTAALEQELSARRIERDMEELERLRKLNEGDPMRKALDPTLPGLPPTGPGAVPPFGHEVRPGAPG